MCSISNYFRGQTGLKPIPACTGPKKVASLSYTQRLRKHLVMGIDLTCCGRKQEHMTETPILRETWRTHRKESDRTEKKKKKTTRYSTRCGFYSTHSTFYRCTRVTSP